jgi:hypothetical protein
MPHDGHSMKWGARSKQPVANDFYATPNEAIRPILKLFPPAGDCLEPGNGTDAIGKFLPPETTLKIDIDPQMVAEIYGDFLEIDFGTQRFDTIASNPPFNLNADCRWTKKCLSLLKPGGHLLLFMKLLWAETPIRSQFCWANPPKAIYCFGDRIVIGGANGICYAWWVWEEGFKGKTQFHWVYPEFEPTDPRQNKLEVKLAKALHELGQA